MGGTLGTLSFDVPAAGVVLPDVEASGGSELAAGGITADAVGGHAGAPLSLASEAPFVVVNGGTPSGVWLAALFAPACVCMGPSLIFT